ncbi:MAG: acetoacetate metabolism regulatory protein AtoC [Nitrospirales bacterium]|nr:MAG: acetoacetate metabolism regulatory protein AtoC [Nitrospirales bacterium]
MSSAHTLLIIEDEERMCRVLELALRPEGYELVLAKTVQEGFERLHDLHRLDLILTDLQIGSVSGLDILEAATQLSPEVPVVIISGYGTVKFAVEATRKGAYDCIPKPVDHEELKIVVRRALAMRQLTQENESLKYRLSTHISFERIVAVSPQMKEIIRLGREVANTDTTILITGESGTGKEIVAHAIHHESARARRPFLAVNCAGIPDELLESELFGYEKGAFTDAKKSKPGRFQLAEGGTLFLDEVGAMSVSAQAKVLRVMEDRIVYPLGGVRGVKVNIRIMAATHDDLTALIHKGQFRDDLFYRLHVYPIHLPPLRERRDDIVPISQAYLIQAHRERGSRPCRFTPDALSVLEQYAWPGNIRELQHVIEWVLVTCKEETIGVEHLPTDIRMNQQVRPTLPSLLSLGLSVEQVEEAMMKEALAKTSGNISEACRLLGMTRNTLRYRMEKFGISSRKVSKHDV